MKNSKFWIWFIPLFLIICVVILVLLVNTKNKNDNNNNKNNTTQIVNEDGKKIKESYERLNNEEGFVNVNLSENNSYYYAKEDEIKNLLNGSDGIIYFGEVSTNSARKTVSILDEAVSQTSITKVYYLDLSLLEDDFIDYLKNKLNVKNITAAMTVTIQKGKVIKAYTPFTNDSLEVTKEEHNYLLKEYQELIKNFIDACDENC